MDECSTRLCLFFFYLVFIALSLFHLSLSLHYYPHHFLSRLGLLFESFMTELLYLSVQFFAFLFNDAYSEVVFRCPACILFFFSLYLIVAIIAFNNFFYSIHWRYIHTVSPRHHAFAAVKITTNFPVPLHTTAIACCSNICSCTTP